MKSGRLNILWTNIYLRGYFWFLGLRNFLLKQHRLGTVSGQGVTRVKQTKTTFLIR